MFKRRTEREEEEEVAEEENIPTEKLLPWVNRVTRCIAKKAEKIMVLRGSFSQQTITITTTQNKDEVVLQVNLTWNIQDFNNNNK